MSTEPAAQESAFAPPRMYAWSATGSGSAAAGEMPVLAVAASAAVSAIPVSKRWPDIGPESQGHQLRSASLRFLDNRC